MVENIEIIEIIETSKKEKWFRESYKELNKNNPFKDMNFFPIRMIDFYKNEHINEISRLKD